MPDSVEKTQTAAWDETKPAAGSAPLTHYRRADEARRQHVDAMQDEVFEKVTAVMESFKIASADKKHEPEARRPARNTRRHKLDVLPARQPLNWLFILLISLGGVSMLVGWSYLF